MHGVGWSWPLLAIVVIPIYFAPLIFAGVRKHTKLFPIVLVNIFLGWSLVGWVAALFWSFNDTIPVVTQHDTISGSLDNLPFTKCAHYTGASGGETVSCRYCTRHLAEKEDGEEPKGCGQPIESREEPNAQIDWFGKNNQFLLKFGQYEDAVVALSSAINADETVAELYFFRAAAYSELNDKVRALEDLEKASSLGYRKAIEQLRIIKR